MFADPFLPLLRWIKTCRPHADIAAPFPFHQTRNGHLLEKADSSERGGTMKRIAAGRLPDLIFAAVAPGL
jgi:hypothetical protein